MVRPVKATFKEQNLPPLQPSTQTKPRSSQAAPDPCPYGMHYVSTQYGVVNCAFD